MSRKTSRECAFKIVFTTLFKNENVGENSDSIIDINANINIEEFSLENNLSSSEDFSFCNSLVIKTLENKKEINDILEKNIVGYNYDRVFKVDKAILMIAICELKFMGEEGTIPVIINEAVELSKKYSSEKSYSFVNGVLSKIVKEWYE